MSGDHKSAVFAVGIGGKVVVLFGEQPGKSKRTRDGHFFRHRFIPPKKLIIITFWNRCHRSVVEP